MESYPVIRKLNLEFPGHTITITSDVTDALEPGQTKVAVYLTVDGRRHAINVGMDDIRALKENSAEGKQLYEQLAYLVHIRFGLTPSEGSRAASALGL